MIHFCLDKKLFTQKAEELQFLPHEELSEGGAGAGLLRTLPGSVGPGRLADPPILWKGEAGGAGPECPPRSTHRLRDP